MEALGRPTDEANDSAWADSSAGGGFVGAEDLDVLNDLAIAIQRDAERSRARQLVHLAEVLGMRSFVRDGASSLTPWLVRRLGIGRREARWTARLVHLLSRMSPLRSGLELGTITVGHLEVLARVATEARLPLLDDFATQLVAHAPELGVDQYERLCQRWADLADDQLAAGPTAEAGWLQVAPTLFGAADLRGHLTADQAAVVTEALDLLNGPDPVGAPVQRSAKRRNADALADLAHHFLNQPPTKDATPTAVATTARRRPAKPTAIVTIDLDTYLDQTRVLALRGVGEQPDLGAIRCELAKAGAIPRDLADLFLCDADVRRLVLDPQGQPLNLGRPTPTVTTAQRMVLHERDQGCVFPTCDRPAHWCDAHHIVPRSRGGPTDIDNLALLCRHHHRLVHQPGWTLERARDGTISATRTDGASYRRDPTGLVEPSR